MPVTVSNELIDDPSKDITGETIEAIMEVLISKDVLYDPLNSLSHAYEEWARYGMEKECLENQKLYSKQMQLIKDVVRMFESSDILSDETKKHIFTKMQEIQELGMPPDQVASKFAVMHGILKFRIVTGTI